MVREWPVRRGVGRLGRLDEYESLDEQWLVIVVVLVLVIDQKANHDGSIAKTTWLRARLRLCGGYRVLVAGGGRFEVGFRNIAVQ